MLSVTTGFMFLSALRPLEQYLRLPAERVPRGHAHRIKHELHVKPSLLRHTQRLPHRHIMCSAEDVAEDFNDRRMTELATPHDARR